MENLKQKIKNGSAVAEDFEKAIILEGLTMELIVLLASYYKEELSNYNLIGVY